MLLARGEECGKLRWEHALASSKRGERALDSVAIEHLLPHQVTTNLE